MTTPKAINLITTTKKAVYTFTSKNSLDENDIRYTYETRNIPGSTIVVWGQFQCDFGDMRHAECSWGAGPGIRGLLVIPQGGSTGNGPDKLHVHLEQGMA